jgi:rubrerythrin
MNNERVTDLLYQALQTEQDGARVYETAIRCAVNDALKEEWARYLSQTREHEQRLLQVFEALGLDPEVETPGRDLARRLGNALVQVMDQAAAAGPSTNSQLVACECVVHAETKDHLNWELLGHVARKLEGEEADALADAYRQVEDQEDEHLYHTRGWTRELWLQSLGVPAVLPPPEERKDVRDSIAAARAKASRRESL